MSARRGRGWPPLGDCRRGQAEAGLLLAVFLTSSTAAGLRAGAAWARGLEIDLGEIGLRSPAPEFAFQRFLKTRPLDQPAFSADDKRLYFTRLDGRVRNVFSLDLDDREIRQVTAFDEPVGAFLPAHQGGFLIVAQDRGGNENFDLYRFDLATGERRRLTDAGRGDTTLLCGLSPDDRILYFAQTRDHRSEAGLWQVDTESGQARVLLPGDGHTYDCDTVSPDGRYLLYGELLGFDERRLGLLDLETGEAQFIERSPGVNNLDAGFADDGIYFRSARDADGFRLWRYTFGAQAPTVVDLPFDNDLDALAMYARGRVAVLGYRDALAGQVAIFRDGFGRQQSYALDEAAFLTGAVFSDSDPDLGVVITERADAPRRYYLVGRGAPRLLYDANQSGIHGSLFAEARSLLVPSFDGLPIPVHVFIPNGSSRCNRRPALFLIHGGPEDRFDPLYYSVVQFLANRGFVVVTPNVRGSSGFGKTFASLDNGDWGGAHVRDIVAVAEAVRTLDFVDPERLFVAGESFGGFSVMSLITQYPTTFRAAVDLFGFTELSTFVESWPRFLRQHLFVELGFDPRSDRLRNWLVSPLYHVGRIRIPLQIHQGANDSRVPRAQSDWLVERMRAHGQPVEYFVYPDEGHGFTRVTNEADAWNRVVAFFRRWGRQN